MWAGIIPWKDHHTRISVENLDRRIYRRKGCVHKGLLLTSRRYSTFGGYSSVLLINIGITCDLERFIYSRTKVVSFCGQGCFMNYLKNASVLAPLRWTSTISFFVLNKTEPQAHKLGRTTLQKLRLLVRPMQIRFWSADDGEDWWIKVEVPFEVFPGKDDIPVRSPFRVS